MHLGLSAFTVASDSMSSRYLARQGLLTKERKEAMCRTVRRNISQFPLGRSKG